MEKITIGFSKSKNKFALGSLLIRAYMGTPYSHVYLQFYSESLNRVLIYEAVGSGVRFIGSSAWSEHAVEIKSHTITTNKSNQVTLLQYCVDHAGTEYGFMQNLGVPLASIFNLKKNPFRKGKNCSEAIGEFLKSEGYEIKKDVNLLTPLDIDKILESQTK
jgi:uncharacterized protein YycO